MKLSKLLFRLLRFDDHLAVRRQSGLAARAFHFHLACDFAGSGVDDEDSWLFVSR